MRIFFYEIKRLMRMPILWGLLVVFIGFDLFMVYTELGYRDIPEDTFGIYDLILSRSSNLDTDNQTSISQDKNEYEKMYDDYIRDCICIYDRLDMHGVKEMKENMLNFHPTGAYKTFIDRNYDKLNLRVAEIIESGDYRADFYPGDIFKVHKRLYTLLKIISIEAIIITCLSILYIMDIDRLCDTRSLVCSSKLGRSSIIIKFYAGLLFGTLQCAILFSTGICAFVIFTPLSKLWGIPVSSAMVMESSGLWEYPFITFVRLDIGTELLLAITSVIILNALLGLISGAVQLFTHNSYISMLLVSLGFVALLAAPLAARSQTVFKTAVLLNPAVMWQYCGRWFIEHNPALSFAWSEFWTIGIWSTIGIVAFILGRHRLYQKDF